MTFILPGSPDYQQQVAGSMVYLTSEAVNLAAGATMFPAIDTFVQPNFQAIAFLWLPSTLPTDVLAVGLQQLGFTPPQSDLATAQPALLIQIPLVGAAINNIAGASLQLFIKNPQTLVVQGTLHVFGVTAPAFVTPITLSQYEGNGATTGLVNAGAGATVTVLAAPKVGQYYRLKGISYRAGGAAPAANLPLTFKALASGLELCVYASKGAANEADRFPCDIAWFDGVTFTNGTGVAVLGYVVYEVWSN